MTNKTINTVLKSPQYTKLVSTGLKLVSTQRQLENGTLAFTGKVKAGRRTIRPEITITAGGAVISNKFTARWADAGNYGTASRYKQALVEAHELVQKRLAA